MMRRKKRYNICKGIISVCGCAVCVLLVFLIGDAGTNVDPGLPMEGWKSGVTEAQGLAAGECLEASCQSEENRALPSDILDGLYSPYAALLDGTSGTLLAGLNGSNRIYPASMTKMMTAIVAIEHTEDWDAEITLSTEMYRMLYAEHASVAGFEAGERVNPMDLLYGMLLPSGAECCIGYAEWLAGDEASYVEWMNGKAAELGMLDTHFTNTTGLPDEEHYSTAEDMAILLRYGLQNEIFRKIITTETYQTDATAVHPEGLTFNSTLLGRLTGTELENGSILGGKTGYTSKAGLCLASFAQIDGKEYILVTAGAPAANYTGTYHIEDAVAVYGKIR